MLQFPSKLEFVSFLKYTPDGVSEISVESRKVRDGIKNDGFEWGERVIDYAAKRVKEELENFECLSSCFSEDVTLIPVPRSSPLKDKHSLWPSLRICQELVRSTVVNSYIPALVRERSVNVSHLAGAGERPEPMVHYSSTSFEPMLLGNSKRLVLVDDVVTRGSTFMGMAARIFKHNPDAEIRCFTLLRPIRGEIDNVLDPVSGDIIFLDGMLSRRP